MEWPPIIVISAILAVIVIFLRPVEASLGAYAFLLPFDSVLIAGTAGQIHLHVTWLVAMASTCVLLATGIVRRGFIRPPRAALWLCVFVFWAGISFWWAIDSESASFRLPVVALLLALYLGAICLPVTEKELTTVALLSICGACLAAAVSVYQLHEGRHYLSEEKGFEFLVDKTSGRASLWLGSVATDPNILAASLILPFSLALRFLLCHRAWLARVTFTAATILISNCIYLTGSRGGLIASAVVLLFYLLRSRARWRLLVPILIMVTAIAAMPNLLFSRLSQTFEDQGAGRLEIWQAGLETFKQYSILGAGLDCFATASSKYEYLYSLAHFHGAERAPHNSYLGTGVELGVIGLGLLIGSITVHLWTTAKASRSSDQRSRLQLVSYEAACWGLLVAALFADLMWEEYFWLTLMLLVIGLPSRIYSQVRSLALEPRQSASELHNQRA